MPKINFEESYTPLDAEKVSRKVEKYIDESSVSQSSPKKKFKTIRDQKQQHITRRTMKKQVFKCFCCLSSNQENLTDFRTRGQS